MRFFHPLCSYITIFFGTSLFVPCGVMLKIRNRLQELLLWLFSCSASINSNTTLQKYDFKVLLIIRVNDTKFFHKDLCLQLSKNGHKFKVQYDF